MGTHGTPVHISIVLDRSGSMASIASDVVGGFNTFLADQKAHPAGGRITLVQFDGQDPFEILIDDEDLASVGALDPARYLPRGNTPLFDAVGRVIARTDQAILARADKGEPIEDQVVLIITDGLENASREFDARSIAGLIEQRRGLGWVFTFLGVDEATLAEAAAMAIAPANRASWDKTGQGSKDMFMRLSKSTSDYRSMSPGEKRSRTDHFLEEDEGDSDKGLSA
jgi:Mg-chelatase subunit ChlD